MNRILRHSVCALLLVVFPAASVLADASAAAMLFVRGNVLLNGASALRNTAIFKGDRIQTAEGSVVISTTGTTVTIPAQSSLTFDGNAVRLFRGGALVRTVTGMSARTGTLFIRPISSSATFRLAKSDAMVTVTAEAGTVEISGAANATLPQGESAVFSEADSQPPPAPGASGPRTSKRGMAFVLWGGGATGAALCAYFCGNREGRQVMSPIDP